MNGSEHQGYAEAHNDCRHKEIPQKRKSSQANHDDANCEYAPDNSCAHRHKSHDARMRPR